MTPLLTAAKIGYEAHLAYPPAAPVPWDELPLDVRAAYVAAADASKGFASDEEAGEAAHETLVSAAADDMGLPVEARPVFAELPDDKQVSWMLFAKAVREASR